MSRLTPALVVALAVAAPANAQWDYAAWGMSVAEVIAASGGTAQAVDDQKDERILKQQRLATARISQDGIGYDVSFYFDPKKKLLTKVGLYPAEADCEAVVAQQIARLGTPEFEDKAIPLVAGAPPIHEKHYRWADSGGGTIEMIDLVLSPSIRHCQILFEK